MALGNKLSLKYCRLLLWFNMSHNYIYNCSFFFTERIWRSAKLLILFIPTNSRERRKCSLMWIISFIKLCYSFSYKKPLPYKMDEFSEKFQTAFDPPGPLPWSFSKKSSVLECGGFHKDYVMICDHRCRRYKQWTLFKPDLIFGGEWLSLWKGIVEKTLNLLCKC